MALEPDLVWYIYWYNHKIKITSRKQFSELYMLYVDLSVMQFLKYILLLNVLGFVFNSFTGVLWNENINNYLS